MTYAPKIKSGNETIGLYPIYSARMQTELMDSKFLRGAFGILRI